MAKSKTNGDCGSMYDTICEKRFDKLDTKQDELLALMRGHNSKPGLVDEVRSIKKVHHALYAAIILILSTIAVQIIMWLGRTLGL
jgi:hypothetical protein